MQNVNLTHMQSSLRNLGVTEFVPGTVSWSDGDRGYLPDGSLSCFGSNNTDAKLKGKQGQVFPYLRSDNYDELLGCTTADEIVVGIEDGTPKTLQEVLETLSKRGEEDGSFVVKAKIEEKHPVVVRVMNAFVPLHQGQDEEYVVPTHYSYQTFDKPRNLLICGHKGGIHLVSDARGDNPLYSARKGESGETSLHYYKVVESKHEVGQGNGGDKKGVGLKGMGGRDNVFCIVSVPNKYDPPLLRGFSDGVYKSLSCSIPVSEEGTDYRSLGTARAAVLEVDDESVGFRASKEVDINYEGEEAIVVTLLYYNTIKATSFDPSEAVSVPPLSIAAAVNDMKFAYSLCRSSGRLSELGPMLVKMTEDMMDVVKQKKKTDPLPPSRTKFEFKAGMASRLAKELVR